MQRSLFDAPLSVPEHQLGSQFTLRQYQAECLGEIKSAYEADELSLLAVLATGLGKTVIFSHLPETLGIRRMLVLAHRSELLDQAAQKIHAANPLMDVEVEQADRSARHDTPIVVASVPTIGRSGSRRIQKWQPDYFDVIVVDEAHHATASTYLNIFRYFGAGRDGGPLLLGVTATPERGDNTPLANVFNRIVYEMPVTAGIEQGYLCRIVARRVSTQTDLREVTTRLGDFAEGELAKAVNTDKRNSFIISAIEDHAADRKCILVFAADIAHVQTLTKQLQDRGFAADGVTSLTEAHTRNQIKRRAESGELRVLVNCGVYTEGFDLPRVDCIVMARPTKSRPLYLQMLGRGTRPSPATGKENLLVLDVVDVCGRHRIETASTVFGMRELDLLGEDVLEAKETCDKAAERGMTIADGGDLKTVRERGETIDLLAKGTIKVTTEAQAIDVFNAAQPCEQVAKDSEFPWVRHDDDRYSLAVSREGEGRMAYLYRDALGKWKFALRGEVNGSVELGTAGEPPFAAADAQVRRHSGSFRGRDGEDVPRWKALSMGARWRNQPPSDGQVKMLRRLGVLMLPAGTTRGSASQLINHLKALRGN